MLKWIDAFTETNVKKLILVEYFLWNNKNINFDQIVQKFYGQRHGNDDQKFLLFSTLRLFKSLESLTLFKVFAIFVEIIW